MHATKQWRDQHWMEPCKERLNLFKYSEAREQPNNMFCCSHTWTESWMYLLTFQIPRYRIITTACAELLISVSHRAKWKHKISVRLNNTGVFAAAWHGWSVSLATNDVTPTLSLSWEAKCCHVSNTALCVAIAGRLQRISNETHHPNVCWLHNIICNKLSTRNKVLVRSHYLTCATQACHTE